MHGNKSYVNMLSLSQNSLLYKFNAFLDSIKMDTGVRQGCILSPCLLNLYAEYIKRHTGLDEAQAGIKISGRNNNTQICRWHHPYGRKWRTKEPLDESETGEWKSCLKTQNSEN